MRARYSAFAVGNVDFIQASTVTRNRHQVDRDSTEAWSKQSEWHGLEILDTEAGGPSDDTGIVEFVAHYAAGGEEVAHHEVASFEKVDGTWFFVDGILQNQQPFRRTTPKIGNNDPCPCGSGLKWKKCCKRSKPQATS